jgi:broad specificity phosphatase PhoE
MNAPTDEQVERARIAQSHVVVAVHCILRHSLPLTPEGAEQAARLMRLHSLGNSWPCEYLRGTIDCAQTAVAAIRAAKLAANSEAAT